MTDRLRCEAQAKPYGGLTPPCGRKAVGQREMICRSGAEITPVLPACAGHLRQKRMPVMFESWG